MSINSVSSTSALFNIQPATTTSLSSITPNDSISATGGVAVDISKPGQLMSQLSALAQSDPDQFKSVTASIAQQLKDAASSQSGSAADVLNKLSDRFSAASQSGSVSDLSPGAGKAHGHHHGGGGHHKMQQASATDASTSATGAGASDPLAQLIQGVISSALETSSTSSST